MTSSRRKLIAVDFDGGLHSYSSPWTDAATISDGPTPGAMRFLLALADDDRFDIVIVSSRLKDEAGLIAVQQWLEVNLYEELDGMEADQAFQSLDYAVDRPPAFVTIDDRGLTFDGTWPDLDTLAAFKPWNKRPEKADTFELLVADCLPDDDDGGEEPGAMCKRAFAKASTSVDLIRQVAIKMSGSDDRADFERSYPIEQKKALLGTAREIIELVRGSSVEGPLPELGLASKASADERSNNWKLNVAESYVGTLSPNGGPGGSPEFVDAIPLSEYLAHLEGKRS